MLIISRKYEIGVSLPRASEVETKIKNFGISIIKTDYYTTSIFKKEVTKVYFKCISDEETMDKLIEDLQLNFTGVATITF